MAKIVLENNGKEIEITDGELLRESCESIGVPFGCKRGVCGTCRVEVLEGEDNLSDINEKEEFLGATKKERYACQACIKKGTLKIKF